MLLKALSKINKRAEDEQRKRGVPEDFIKKAIFIASEAGEDKRTSCGLVSLDPLFGSSFDVTVDEDGNKIKTNFTYGIKQGMIYILFGPEASGKTTLTYQIIASMQKSTGKYALVVDVEGRSDKRYAANLGIDLDKLIIIKRNTFIEKSFDDILDLIQTGEIGVVILDSLHAGTNKAEFNEDEKIKSVEDNYAVGTAAKKNNQFIRFMTPLASQFGCTFFIIGQARDNMDTGNIFLTGGHVAKHHADAILRVQRTPRGDWPKEGDKFIGFRSRITVEKSSGTSTNESIELPYYQGLGFNEKEQTVRLAIEQGIIEQGGAWFKIPKWNTDPNDLLKIQGFATLMEFLNEPGHFTKLLKLMGVETQVLQED